MFNTQLCWGHRHRDYEANLLRLSFSLSRIDFLQVYQPDQTLLRKTIPIVIAHVYIATKEQIEQVCDL